MTDNAPEVEEIVRSLSFDVVAIPGQSQKIVPNSTSKATPLKIKVKVKKKHEGGLKHGVLATPVNDTEEVPQRIRLVSSDQTIMSFNAVMEDVDFDKSKVRPPNLPNTDNRTIINKDDVSSKNQLLLSKVEDNSNKKRDFFGRCRPGGCLDPPFGEDKYSYKPIKQEQKTEILDTLEKKRTSSIFSNILFNKIKKAKPNIADKKDENESNQSDTSLYQTGSLQISNSLITYPSPLNVNDDKVIQDRLKSPRHSAQRKSTDSDKGSLYIIPKKTRASLEKEEAKLNYERDKINLDILSKELGNNGDAKKCYDDEKIHTFNVNNLEKGGAKSLSTDAGSETKIQEKKGLLSKSKVDENLSDNLIENARESKQDYKRENNKTGVKTELITAAATAAIAATIVAVSKDYDKKTSDDTSPEKESINADKYIKVDDSKTNETMLNDKVDNNNETTIENNTDVKTEHGGGIVDGDQLIINAIEHNNSEVNHYKDISNKEGKIISDQDSNKVFDSNVIAANIGGGNEPVLKHHFDLNKLDSKHRDSKNKKPNDLNDTEEFHLETNKIDHSEIGSNRSDINKKKSDDLKDNKVFDLEAKKLDHNEIGYESSNINKKKSDNLNDTREFDLEAKKIDHYKFGSDSSNLNKRDSLDLKDNKEFDLEAKKIYQDGFGSEGSNIKNRDSDDSNDNRYFNLEANKLDHDAFGSDRNNINKRNSVDLNDNREFDLQPKKIVHDKFGSDGSNIKNRDSDDSNDNRYFNLEANKFDHNDFDSSRSNINKINSVDLNDSKEFDLEAKKFGSDRSNIKNGDSDDSNDNRYFDLEVNKFDHDVFGSVSNNINKRNSDDLNDNIEFDLEAKKIAHEKFVSDRNNVNLRNSENLNDNREFELEAKKIDHDELGSDRSNIKYYSDDSNDNRYFDLEANKFDHDAFGSDLSNVNKINSVDLNDIREFNAEEFHTEKPISKDRDSIKSVLSDDLSDNIKLHSKSSSLDKPDKADKQFSNNNIVTEITPTKASISTNYDDKESESDQPLPTIEGDESNQNITANFDKIAKNDDDFVSVFDRQRDLQDNMFQKGNDLIQLEETLENDKIESGDKKKDAFDYKDMEMKQSKNNSIEYNKQKNIPYDEIKKDISSHRLRNYDDLSENLSQSNQLQTRSSMESESIKKSKINETAGRDERIKHIGYTEQIKTKIDLGFHTYTNENNELFIKTFDGINPPSRYPNDSVVLANCDLKNPFDFKVPFGTDQYLWIQIKDNKTKILPGTAESSKNIIMGKKQNTILHKIDEQRNSTIKNAMKSVKLINNDIVRAQMKDIYSTYENDLVPLHKSLTRLKQDVDVLILHQKTIRNSLLTKRSKIQGNRKCGCVKKLCYH